MDLKPAVDEWARAQVLIFRPSWNQSPKAAWHLERVVAEWPTVRSAVLELIDDTRPLVVAYALAAAWMARDEILLELNAQLLQSTASVTVDEGSFRTRTDLGSLARMWSKEARSFRVDSKILELMRAFVSGGDVSIQAANQIETGLDDAYPEDDFIQQTVEMLAMYRPGGGPYLFDFEAIRARLVETIRHLDKSSN